MRRKGRTQVGADAVIVVFDPETVIDTATFEGGQSFSEGIFHTMVNGVFVVRDGETVEGAAPGRAIVKGTTSQAEFLRDRMRLVRAG